METSVLVIGKSGVGKSSLLNYMFSAEIEKTGAGKPVTEKGIFPHRYEYSENFTINIYDTWGLEADKSEEWQALIDNEVREHDKKSIEEWFHTVIYCLSANSDRVEDFECDMIKNLLASNNNIVVALTHAKTPDINEKKGMVNILVARTGIDKSRIINVSSVEKKTLGGKVTEKFGKNEIFTAILKNLWNSICSKLPFNIMNDIHRHLVKDRQRQLDKVNGRINVKAFLKDKLNFKTPSRTLDSFGEEISADIEKLGKAANRLITNRFKEANDYYFELFKTYNEHIDDAKKIDIHINARCDFLKSYNENLGKSFTATGFVNITNLFFSDIRTKEELISTVKGIAEGIKINWLAVGKKRDFAKKSIAKCYSDIESECKAQVDKIAPMLKEAYLVSDEDKLHNEI